MAVNYFHENRKLIQKALYSSGFVKVIEGRDYTIEEQQLKKGCGKLREVKLVNLPSNTWCINLETTTHSPFAIAGKVPEVAILFHTESAFYILMVGIKAQLNYKRTSDTQEKLENALRKLAVLLPIHIYDNTFDDVRHRHIGIIAYNDSSDLEGTLRTDHTKSRKSPICNLFETTTKRNTLNLDDDDLGRYRMDVAFCQNPNIATSPEYMEIDLANFLRNYPDFLAITDNAKTCPKL